MSPDVWRVRKWILLHHAGFLTYPHHDANGLATIIVPEHGAKFWGIMRPKHYTGQETREEFLDLIESSMSYDQDQYQAQADIFIVFAQPGDIM